LVIVKTSDRESVQKTIRSIFGKITNELENQPTHFPKPRCGGRETNEEKNTEYDMSKTAYMVGLEMLALAQNPQDAGPAEPPKRFRKFKISYASAAKSGILKPATSSPTSNVTTSSEYETPTITNTQSSIGSSSQRQVSWDDSITATNRSLGSSLSRSTTNSKIANIKRNFEQEIREINTNMEKCLAQQDKQLQEIKQSISSMNEEMETRMAQAVILALVKEKHKVQELTHGQVYDKKMAPLADENGRLPGGAIVQSGGPLDRLHHVEVTVQQMSNVLDTIAAHLYRDPESKHLFKQPDRITGFLTEEEYLDNYIDNDVPMMMIKESGIKRGLQRQLALSPSRSDMNDDLDKPPSPKSTPPPKRERSDSKPPAKPAGTSAREREEL
jgi:hypothetical protein